MSLTDFSSILRLKEAIFLPDGSLTLDLIQSQKSEQGEDGIVEQDQDLLQPRESDLNEDDVKFPIDQLDDQTRVPAPDIIDELGL